MPFNGIEACTRVNANLDSLKSSSVSTMLARAAAFWISSGPWGVVHSRRICHNSSMPTNIEIKYRVADLASIEKRVVAIANSGPELLILEDIFFPVATGRLKLRKFADGSAELIGYHRDDASAVRESSWMAYTSLNPESLQAVLEKTLGRGLTVRKSRTLYKVDHTRIHLDRVERLGEFVELEVVLPDSRAATAEDGTQIANRLIGQLKLDVEEQIAVAYVDLLSQIE